ncbi:hypothetical protein J3R83DRAFT_1561 [Lanmaoa asiatica]|nr:hypothetical protein J3R83DRAFT_1561 [Lanmaoa asiatica]
MPEEITDNQSSLIGELRSFPANTSSVARCEPWAAVWWTPTTTLRDAASLRPPSSISQTDKYVQALRLIWLRQPFGALLFTPNFGNLAALRSVITDRGDHTDDIEQAGKQYTHAGRVSVASSIVRRPLLLYDFQIFHSFG